MKAEKAICSYIAMSSAALGGGEKLESKTVEDICDYLEEKGFNASVVEALQGIYYNLGRQVCKGYFLY